MNVRGALAALSIGCQASPALETGFERDLSDIGGCADLIAYAVNVQDTVMLTARLDGPLAAAELTGSLAAAGGEPVVTEVALPDPFAVVSVDIGRAVSDATCDDLVINGGPEVRETWEGAGGSVRVVVRPGEQPGDDPSAEVTITNVLLQSPDGEQVTVDTFEWTDLSVGWFPG